MIKVIFFDLFFTLIVPDYDKANNEFEILGLTQDEWENYAENNLLYRERALGLVKSEKDIIDKIASVLPFGITDLQKVSREIIEILAELKAKVMKNGFKLWSPRIIM